MPKLSERKLKALEREAAREAAIAEQDREAAALAEVGVHVPPAAPIAGGAAAAADDCQALQGQQQQQQGSQQPHSTGQRQAVAVATMCS